MAAIIATHRLILREWRTTDVAAYHAACETPAVTRWLGGPQPIEAAEQACRRMQASQAEHGYCFWIVERRADAALLGYCGLMRTRDPGTPVAGDVEIGWRLREDAWRQGYAREAAAAALTWGLARPEIARIVAITVPGNYPSWGLMERLGLVRRPDLDFEHPAYPKGHALSRHIVYAMERPS